MAPVRSDRNQAASERPASGTVPVFPLPAVVFFPHTILPLHVFEARYCAMVRDAVEGDGIIAVSLLRPGWDADYEGSPAFYEVGSAGRIEDLDPLPDGRFLLRLVGLQRIAFGEVVKGSPYRVVRFRALGETSVDESDPEVRAAKLDLLASHGCLLRELTSHDSAGVVLDERIPFETAVNGACANLPVDPALRQALLEENDLRERQRRAAALLNEVLERVLRLKSMRSRDEEEGDSGVN
jgi:Lon protease-like protein